MPRKKAVTLIGNQSCRQGRAAISNPPHRLHFFAFAGDSRTGLEARARGNPCAVTLLADASAEPDPEAVSAHCASWRSGSDVATVCCWTAGGQPITLCGHGLLSTGVAWLRHDGGVSELEMNGLRVAFAVEDDWAWIGLPHLGCDACAVPLWAREFFPELPWRAARAGDENGYLILEWPAGFDLRRLPVPDYGLRRRTQRAIIATCVDREDPGIDVQLRYFAPQHGVPEDTATGSAMRALATYWVNRELNDGLHAFQCSPFGGELRSRIRGDRTWVGGRIVCTRDSLPHAA
ncbi:MAG: PhzF family phenazine biosynthesis protein [Pseudomonadota bacterium]